MSTLAVNKRAKFDYDLLSRYEAGLVLLGHEVKSIKTGHISLKGSHLSYKGLASSSPELFLLNANIPLYRYASTIMEYEPTRPRKVLLKRSELLKLAEQKREKGLTLVPVRIYTKQSLVKLEFALARGKKKFDKREAIKNRDVDRRLRTLTKRKTK